MTTDNNTLPQVATFEPTQTQVAAWLNMAKGKNMMLHNLSALELQAQGVLLPLKTSEDYKAIDEGLAAYRKLNTDMIEMRKTFTNAVNTGIVQPLMAPEKRVEESEDYKLLTNKSLTLRKAEAEKASAANSKNAEIARFKAHIENEFFRVAAEFRELLRHECIGQYEIALREKLSGDTSDIKKMLATLPVPQMIKFNTAILTQAEKQSTYAACVKERGEPNFQEMYNEACKGLDTLFANFNSDLANAEAAISHNKQQTQLVDIAETKKLQEDVAINTLITTSETVVINEPKIKKTLHVVLVESEGWAKSVMAAFIANMPHLAGKMPRVKSWANLNVGQMAAALGQLASETGLVFNNIQLQEVEK